VITTRALHPDEWEGRLVETELPALLPYLTPANTSVVVVEDGEKLLASMAVMRVTHYEGVWIAPEARGNLGVTRSLLRMASVFPKTRGETFVFGGAADDRMRDILQRMGGAPMPLEFYALSLGSKECRQQ
jgi:hypothetical protein